MAATVFASTFPLSSGSQAKASSYDRLQLKASSLVEGGKHGREDLSSSPKTVAYQLSDKSWFPVVDATASVGVEDRKPRPPSSLLIDSFGLGRNTEDGFVFGQSFTIRSYEVGADERVSLETLMNLLQEVVLNQFKVAGLLSEGFGSTPLMVKRNLIWVASQFHVMVDRYPSWGDVIQVETWITLPAGKNKMCSNWLVLDIKTGETLARASCMWVMMSKHTRKLCKFPNEVRTEIRPHSVERLPIVGGHERKLCKLDDNTSDKILDGLTARWKDLDVNEHVNNVKYVGWLLESTPEAMMESHELSSINIEYKRECGRDSILQSLIAISGATDEELSAGRVECQHMLRLRDGPEVLRARTQWRLKLGSPRSS